MVKPPGLTCQIKNRENVELEKFILSQGHNKANKIVDIKFLFKYNNINR